MTQDWETFRIKAVSLLTLPTTPSRADPRHSGNAVHPVSSKWSTAIKGGVARPDITCLIDTQ